MDGLNQSQVRPDIGYTFAFGLRTGLRQDPDIMMVGEIRDKETIDVAIESALTGHLVFSTIHTNSAAATITRILDMNVPNFLITSTINTIIAQRLVRKICEHCKTETSVQPAIEKKIRTAIRKMNPQEREKLKLTENAPLKIYKGEGCENCGSSGYQGRLGLFEVMALDKDLKKIILGGASEQEIEEAAINTGMKTLEQDGIVKILRGLTTPEEIYRVVRYSEQ
jgi:type IV pilus assembly protein PilB